MTDVAASARREAPAGYDEAADLLRGCADEGVAVRPVGGGTKLAWGGGVRAGVELSTGRLAAVVEHNAGDLTAVLQAGVRLADAEAAFADAGQMLALDPPAGGATIGGVVATADSGPLRHRYGGPRDLVIGVAVALSDGTVARSGGKVIKNVAGYDLAKLYTGSYGTLGLILEVAVRLHPLPRARVTVSGRSDDPDALARGALALAHAPLEMEALDVEWGGGAGAVHARFAGAAAEHGADTGRRLLGERGVAAEAAADDEAVWARQRERQRSADGIVARVSGRPSELARVVAAAERAGGSLVARAALGLSWVTLPADADAVAALRRDLAPAPVAVLDAPASIRAAVDPWDLEAGGALPLMRRVKARFDPAGICSPGVLWRADA